MDKKNITEYMGICNGIMSSFTQDIENKRIEMLYDGLNGLNLEKEYDLILNKKSKLPNTKRKKIKKIMQLRKNGKL